MDRSGGLGEIKISDEVALKLKAMSSATTDRKLKHQREVLAHLLVAFPLGVCYSDSKNKLFA